MLLAALAATLPTRALALYDPQPSPLLQSAPGAWSGTLTYRDWSNPDKLVTLPCRLAVALSAPDELALFYVFDDGPGKVVYSYDRMSFDFKAGTLDWVSGVAKPSRSQYVVTRAAADADGAELLFERSVEDRTDRYTFALRRTTLELGKTEVASSGEQRFRNRYEFRRAGA
jgi:hypothetical protein